MLNQNNASDPITTRIGVGSASSDRLHWHWQVCGLGLRGYLSKVDNRFDAFIVVTGLLDLLLSLTLRWTEAVRFVRLARIVRILRIMRPLRLMMWTMTIALPALGNVSILFLLGLYVYSAIGVASFWSVGFSPAIVSVANTTTEDDYFYSHDYTNEGNFLNRNANFYDFWHAMLTMVHCARIAMCPRPRTQATCTRA